MISAIGTMIGFYIITRSLSFITRKGDRQESAFTIALSFITILVTAFCLLILIFGAGETKLPNY